MATVQRQADEADQDRQRQADDDGHRAALPRASVARGTAVHARARAITSSLLLHDRVRAQRLPPPPTPMLITLVGGGVAIASPRISIHRRAARAAVGRGWPAHCVWALGVDQLLRIDCAR